MTSIKAHLGLAPAPARFDIGASLAIVDTAQAVIALHTPTPDGYCRGCLDQWARLAPADCEPVRWAREVYAELGAESNVGRIGPVAGGDDSGESR